MSSRPLPNRLNCHSACPSLVTPTLPSLTAVVSGRLCSSRLLFVPPVAPPPYPFLSPSYLPALSASIHLVHHTAAPLRGGEGRSVEGAPSSGSQWSPVPLTPIPTPPRSLSSAVNRAQLFPRTSTPSLTPRNPMNISRAGHFTCISRTMGVGRITFSVLHRGRIVRISIRCYFRVPFVQ